jgi:hypothetical protein
VPGFEVPVSLARNVADDAADGPARRAWPEAPPRTVADLDRTVCGTLVGSLAELPPAVSLAPLLLDHIGSTWPPVYAAQWLLERITIRAAGEHFTRRQLPLVQAAGFQVIETGRLKAGTVKRIHAVKPA